MRIRTVRDSIRTIGWLVVSLILIGNGSWLDVTGFSTAVCSIRSPPPQSLSTRHSSQQSRPSQPEPYDKYYDDQDDDEDDQVPTESIEKDGYWDEEEPKPSKKRGGLYKVQFDAATEIDPKETQLDWEVCSDGETEALVLLPPEAVQRPSAVLHFVGGTFFGSLPKIYYRSFLEGLVRNTQCAVVVTPIPVTLLRSPLQHIALGRKLQASFETAWKSVLEDEYGNLDDVVRMHGENKQKYLLWVHDSPFSQLQFTAPVRCRSQSGSSIVGRVDNLISKSSQESHNPSLQIIYSVEFYQLWSGGWNPGCFDSVETKQEARANGSSKTGPESTKASSQDTSRLVVGRWRLWR
jgi:hypothetical protein